MKKRMLICLSAAAMMTFTALSALAVQPSTARGTLHGIVTDPSGAAVPGASVVVIAGDSAQTVLTDESGQYTVSGLVPGHYRVQIHPRDSLNSRNPGCSYRPDLRQ